MKCAPKARLMDYKRGWGEAEGLRRSGEREELSHVQVLSFRWSSTVDPVGFAADTVRSKAVTIWEHWTAAGKCRRYEMLGYCVDLETLKLVRSCRKLLFLLSFYQKCTFRTPLSYVANAWHPSGLFFVVLFFFFQEPNIVITLSKSGEQRFLNKFSRHSVDFKNLVAWLLSAQSHTWPTGFGFFPHP